MAKQFLNPDGLSRSTAYTHVITATDGKMVFISGQVAFDSEGKLVGAGDFRAQVRQVLKNLEIAVRSVGGSLTDIVKTTTYIPNYDMHVHRPVLGEVRKEVFGDHLPGSTLVGIQSLAFPELLVEIEAIAVID